MKVETLVVIKEKMLRAKREGKEEEFKKYYNMFSAGYKEITGKDFSEEMEKMKQGKHIKPKEQER